MRLGLLLFSLEPRPFDGLGLESFNCASDLADLVAAPEAGQDDREITIAELDHCARHRAQRPRDRPADQETERRHTEHDHQYGDLHLTCDRGACRRARGVRLISDDLHGLLNGLDRRLDRRIGIRCCLLRTGKRLGGGEPSGEVALIGDELCRQLVLGGGRDGGRTERRGEFGCPLLHLLAVLRITAQHEILLVPAHHQHRHQKTRLIELFELGFDVMDGIPQRALETRVLVEAELTLGVRERGKTHHIGVEPRLDLADLALEIGGAGQACAVLQRGEIVGNQLGELGVPADVAFFIAQQEIFLGAPAFEQLDRNLGGSERHAARICRDGTEPIAR